MVELDSYSFYKTLSISGIDVTKLECILIEELKSKNLKLATAESCTGGLVSQRITSVAGSSEVFDFGVCSYANNIKEKVLGVSGEVLQKDGAVSPQTAVMMAQGARKIAQSDVAVSVTGIAGPTGGTEEKPVGLVYFGVSAGKGSFAVRGLLKNEDINDREKIRQTASDVALYLALSAVRGLNGD